MGWFFSLPLTLRNGSDSIGKQMRINMQDGTGAPVSGGSPVASAPQDLSALAAAARRIRRRSLQMTHAARLGHPGGDFSAADILATLYLSILRLDPANPAWPERDRFILSKGHCSGALYAALVEAGFLPLSALETYQKPLSLLNGHPDRNKVAGVEANTGPLGHGLSIGVGTAKAAKITGLGYRTFVLTGDGELQEGSNWEAAMAASHFALDNLTVIVDRNRLQQGARTEATISLEPLAERWRSFGWHAVEVNGHDLGQLHATLHAVPLAPGQPTCIIANTVKGRGVSFMEDRAEWHHHVPTDAELVAALAELADDTDREAGKPE